MRLASRVVQTWLFPFARLLLVLTLCVGGFSAAYLQVTAKATARADDPPPSGAPTSITLAANRTTFSAGQSVTLTATADVDVSQSASVVRIVDQSNSSTLVSCTTGTTCSATVSFLTGPSRDFVATVNSLTSSTVTLSRATWAVSLTVDRSVIAAGQRATLTATANQDIGGSNGAFGVYIYDETTGDLVASCEVGNRSDWTVDSAGETQCVDTEQFSTGPAHTYIAAVAAVPSDAPSSATDVQATSNEVTVSRAPWTLTLTTDVTQLAAGQRATLTATANQNVGNAAFGIYLYDETAGDVVVICDATHTAAWTVDSSGNTVCAATQQLLTGSPHTYVALVAASSADTPASATAVQATSNELQVTRQAWAVTLSSSSSTVTAGHEVTLTAVANQNIGGTNGSYSVYIYDKTSETVAAYCDSAHPGSWTTTADGQTVCTADVAFFTGGPHSYSAVVAHSPGNAPSEATDVQATSNELAVSRAPWTLSLTEDKTIFAAGERVTITATANQNVGGTNGHYGVYIYDETTGDLVDSCDSTNSWTYTVDASGGTVCSVSEDWFFTGGPHTYIAVVAASPWTSPTDIRDTQATSNEVTLTRELWTISLAESLAYIQPPYARSIVTATTNQSLDGTNRNYGLYLVDNQTGTVAGLCDWQYGTQNLQIVNGQSFCNFPIATPMFNQPDSYTAVVAHIDSNFQISDIQASSFAALSPSIGGPALAAEMVGGANAAEPGCQQCSGDPVDTATGAFIESATDLNIPGVGPAVDIARTYDSSTAATDGPFGRGWAMNYNEHLSFTGGDTNDPLPRTVAVTQENGATIYFAEDGNQNYLAPARVHASLTYHPNEQIWTFVRHETQTLEFDANGRVMSVEDQNNNTVDLAYDSGHLASITAAGGREIDLGWSGGHITSATDSAGREVDYHYDANDNLDKVTEADGRATSFNYNSTHDLTAITSPGGHTTNNSYDGQDRVVSQTDPDNRTTSSATPAARPASPRQSHTPAERRPSTPTTTTC